MHQSVSGRSPASAIVPEYSFKKCFRASSPPIVLLDVVAVEQQSPEMPPKIPASAKPQGSVQAFLRLTGTRFICIRSGFLRNVRRIIEVSPSSISILGLDMQTRDVFPLEDILEVQVTGDTTNQLCIRTKAGSETFYCEARPRLLAALYAVLRSHLKEARAAYEVTVRFPHAASPTAAALSVNDWGILYVSGSKTVARPLLPQQTILPFFSIAYLCPLSDQPSDFGIMCTNGSRVIVSCENRHAILAHINENTFQRLGSAIQSETLTLSHFLAEHSPPDNERASTTVWPSENGRLPYTVNVQRHFVSHWGNAVDDECLLRLAVHSDGIREMSGSDVVSFVPWDAVECFVKQWGSGSIFGVKLYEGTCPLWSIEPDCDTFLVNCISIYKHAVRWSFPCSPRLTCEDTSFDRYIWGGPSGKTCDAELEEGLMKRIIAFSDKVTHECEAVIVDYYANVFHPGDPSKDRSLSRTIMRILLHETQRGLKDPFLFQLAQLASRMFQKKNHFEEVSSHQALTDVVAYGLSSNEQLLTWAISELLLAASCAPDGPLNKAELANRSALLPGTSMDALTAILAHPQLHERHLGTSIVLHLLDLLVSSRADNTPFDVNRSMLQRFRTLRRRIYNLTRSNVLMTSVSATRLLIVILQGSNSDDVARIQNECRDDTTLLWHLLLCLNGHPDQRVASMSLLELLFHENASCMNLLNRMLPATIPLGLKEKWVEASSAVLRHKAHRGSAADNSFSREVTLNWAKFFEYLNGDYLRPDLIWNSTTRGELVAALKRQLEIFAQAEVSGNRQITWNYSEFEVVYSSLSDKIRVGRFYIDLLLVDDTHVAAFDGIVRLLGGLFLRLLTSSVEKERSVCLRVMTKLYRTSNQEPLDPHALNCVVKLLRVLPSDLQLQAMEFFNVALQHPGNARNFVSFGGIMEILTIITLGQINSSTGPRGSASSSPALPPTPRTRRASISIDNNDALLFSVVKVLGTICSVQPAVCSLGRPIRPIPAVRGLIFETNHILLLTDILSSRTARIVKATLELIQEAIIGHSTQILDQAFASAGTIPSLLALAASADDAIALCASQIIFNTYFNSDGKITSNDSEVELFKWIPVWLAAALSCEGPIKFTEILRGGIRSPKCVWAQIDTSTLLDVCATLFVPELPIGIEYSESMMFSPSQKELGGYFVDLLVSDWTEVDPVGHAFVWSSKDPLDMLQCLLHRFSRSDAIESIQLHSVLNKCIKLFCHTPAFASWPNCQDVLINSVATLLHHYSFVYIRPESKSIFHFAASSLDYASNSSSENALLMCSVPNPTNFDALSCCFRAICSGIVRSPSIPSAENLTVASFCSSLPPSSCEAEIPLILSSASYCCNVAKFFGSEINAFVPQLLYHYIPLILISSHEVSAVSACCQLLVTLSPLINSAAFDVDCGIVEVLLLSMLQIDLNSPQLAQLSHALLRLCSDHPKIYSICVRYIPSSIIPLEFVKQLDSSDDTIAATVSTSAACLDQFCGNFFEDILVPDCVWTQDCRNELLHAIFQRTMILPSMLSSVSDDSVISPVIATSNGKFITSAQAKFTLIHGVYLELFVSSSKWVCRESKALLEQLLTQLSDLYQDSDSPKSPTGSHSTRFPAASPISSESVALLLRSVHRCLVNDDNLVIFKNGQTLSFLRKIFSAESSDDTTRMLILSLWDCVADDHFFCEYFVDSGLCASLVDQCFAIISGSSQASADRIAFALKAFFVLTKCCRSSHVVAHLHRSGYLLFFMFALLSCEPLLPLGDDACHAQSPFLEISNIAGSAMFGLVNDKNRGSLIKQHLRHYFPAVFIEYMLLDPSGDSERGDSGESIHDVSLLMAGFGQLTLAEAFWQKWSTPTLMWSPSDALALKTHCRDGCLQIQQQIREVRMKKEALPCWDPMGYKTDAVLYEENHLVAGVFLSALNSHPDLPLPNAVELMKQALIQLVLVTQLKPIPLRSNLQPPKWDIDLAATIALVIRILSTPGVVMRDESTAASRAIFALEKALVQQYDGDSVTVVPVIIQCVRSLRLCATIAAATHAQNTPAALSRSELEPSPELEEAARFNVNLITKIPSAREECTRFIYVILLQHAGIVNMLSAPALAGFRSSMTEWRSQLQQLQDAPSISMFKKVDRICRGFAQRE